MQKKSAKKLKNKNKNSQKLSKKKNFFVHEETYISEESTEHVDDLPHHDHGHRPRNLGVMDSLFHLDADWGTSLAYILPLSLSLTGRLSPVYMMIIAAIMFIVASGYKVVCKHNPDGGGVYSSLKKINKFIAVVGALLLVTDYIVTEALSVSDSFHYLQLDTLVHSGTFWFLSSFVINHANTIWTCLIMICLTTINWRGPHFSAKFAGVASSSTFLLAGFLAVLALPLVPAGLANIGHFNQGIFDVLRNTTGVLLALSGVEAISNMTGIMKDPERTSRTAINLELVKVIFTTVVLGIAMNALPANVTYIGTQEANGEFKIETETTQQFDLACVTKIVSNKLTGGNQECTKVVRPKARQDMLVAMGKYLVPGTFGVVYGTAIGLAYGLLLIFAGNTALIDITNVTYSLAKDNELPAGFTKLNDKYGVPIWGLFLGGIMPILTVLIVGANVEALAALYAIGVVGAVSMNLVGTTMQVQGRERIITGVGATVMSILFVTLAVTKMEATLFATLVLIIGLSARAVQKYLSKKSLDSLAASNGENAYAFENTKG